MRDNVLRNEARLGRGKLVDEDTVLERVSPEQLDIAREHGLSAEIDRPQMWEQPLWRKTMGEFSKDRRYGVKYSNPFAIEPVCKLRDAVPAHAVGTERCTRGQAPKISMFAALKLSV
jgi:hypothetical protein